MLKRLFILLVCICMIFALIGCKKENSKTINDPVPFYGLTLNGTLYGRVGETNKDNVDVFLGVVKKAISEEKKDEWYSLDFIEGSKVYKYKGKEIIEAVIVEQNGYYFELNVNFKYSTDGA